MTTTDSYDYWYVDGTTSADSTWTTWSITTSSDNTTWTSWSGDCDTEPLPETDEQRVERERQEAEWERERKSEEKKQKNAEKKAKKLLMGLISKADYRKFCDLGYIDVEGKSGKLYRIEPGCQVKVFESKTKLNIYIDSLCILTEDTNLPLADEVIWKKLMVEANEKQLLKIANHF